MSESHRSVRRLRAQLFAAARLVRTAATNPEMRQAIVAGLRGPRSLAAPRDTTPPPVEHTVPEGLAEYAFHAQASTAVASPVSETVAALLDPARFGEWLTMHAGWRGDPPDESAHAGQTFTQQAVVMGMPVDIAWTVAAADEHGVELRGKGPMGVTNSFWLTVYPYGDGAYVFFDAGIDGPPLKGPMGATVVRTLNDALATSLERAAELLGSTSGAVRRSPVRHEASATMLDPTTPVIVGVGQIVQREPGTDDPVTLSVRALREAATDSGAGEALLRDADAVYAVASISWSYRDQAALVAAALGADPAETVQSSPFGGDGGQLLVNAAAQAIADGEANIVLLTGAEAGASLAAAQQAGTNLHWPVQDSGVKPTRQLGVDRAGHTPTESAVGLGAPIFMYALMESAMRGKLGEDPEQHQKTIGELWSRFSAVAAENPYAWQPEKLTAEQIATPSVDNRMVSTPYTKLLCANLQVDLASGLIMCSAAAAEAAGIPQDKWIFLHAGASGHDEWFVSERTSLAASPAIHTLGSAALHHAGLTIDDVAYVDLYSCFPAAVQIAASELRLPIDDPARPLTVTGGLTFGGGPGNNYGGHGIATLVQRLRTAPSAYGLSTSLGWYSTKHALGIYSATPPAQPYRHLQPIVENPPARPVLTGYTGPAMLEAYTVPVNQDGTAEAGILSTLTPDGARVLLRTTQPDIITALTEDDPLGLPVTVAADDTVVLAGTEPVELPAPPPAPVLIERRGAIMIITLNRPAVRNAINLAAAQALERAIDIFEADDNARVAVLTGAGGSFCSGMDLKAAARGEYPITEKRGVLGLTGMTPVKPLIAAVEGHALAGGCELALASDLIVAAENSEFGIPEPKRGLAAAAGGVMRLTQRLPRNIAMALALTGDPMPATRLAELGLVNEIAPVGRSLEVAITLAETIAANAPISVRVSKQIVDETMNWSTDEAYARQADIASAAVVSQDATEGVLAFNEKRPPVWKGK